MAKKRFSTAGIIVELNPLHNGHAAHISETKALTGRENIIAVMSGNFVQRGEPALLDKWKRTKMALLAGADIVIELPLPYVLGGADYFARGAVGLLHATGLVDCLCFGSESGNIDAIKRGAQILAEEPPAYKQALRARLDAGESFAAARGAALEAALEAAPTGSAPIAPLFIENAPSAPLPAGLTTLPNNGLGMEYCKALALLGNPFEIFTTHRTPGGPSATAIRNEIKEVYYAHNTLPPPQAWENTNLPMPRYAWEITQEALQRGEIATPDGFGDIFRYVLLQAHTTMDEGLHHRFRRATHAHPKLHDLISAVKTKRYTRTRLQRAAMRAVLDITPPQEEARYLRILGFRKNAAPLLGALTRHARLPVITHRRAALNLIAEGGAPAQMLAKEWESTDIYRLIQPTPSPGEHEAAIVQI